MGNPTLNMTICGLCFVCHASCVLIASVYGSWQIGHMGIRLRMEWERAYAQLFEMALIEWREGDTLPDPCAKVSALCIYTYHRSLEIVLVAASDWLVHLRLLTAASSQHLTIPLLHTVQAYIYLHVYVNVPPRICGIYVPPYYEAHVEADALWLMPLPDATATAPDAIIYTYIYVCNFFFCPACAHFQESAACKQTVRARDVAHTTIRGVAHPLSAVIPVW